MTALAAMLLMGVGHGIAEAPRCLVVQFSAPKKEEFDPNVGVANYFASEAEAVGRVTPVVWSASDPIFREALLAGKISVATDAPNLEQARQVAKDLKAEYVLWVEAIRKAPEGNASSTPKTTDQLISQRSINFKGALYRNGREVWKENRQFPVSQGTAFDEENDARTIARTIYLILDSGPWKALPTKVINATPAPDKGQLTQPTVQPQPVPTPITPEAKPDLKQVGELLAPLRTGAEWGRAIALVRDLIDRYPTAPEFRELYWTVLTDAGLPTQAMAAAQAASRTQPNPALFHRLSGSSALQLDELDTAQNEFNQALAHDAKDWDSFIGLARIALLKGDASAAKRHLDQLSSERAAKRDASLLRALASAVSGSAGVVPVPISKGEYVLIATVLDQCASAEADKIRLLQQRAIVKRQDPDVKKALGASSNVVVSCSALLSSIQTLKEFSSTHSRRILAWTLLSQCLGDFESFLKDGDEDAITDSRIGLGEAIKHLTAIKQAFREEKDANDVNHSPPHS